MNIFKKVALVGAGSAVAALGMSFSPATAQQSSTYRIYEYIYYHDAAKTQYAGYIYQRCEAPATVEGVQTAYYDVYPVGQCNNRGGGYYY